MDHVTLKLPRHIVIGLEQLAHEQDVTPGHIIRELVWREVMRRDRAKTPNRADEPLVARLQRLLAVDMASATGWDDMQTRLARHGYVLRPAGGGLCVHDLNTDARLCKSSELGFAYSRLVRKFRAAMPDHPHQMKHILMQIAAEVSHGGDNDLILIEDD